MLPCRSRTRHHRLSAGRGSQRAGRPVFRLLEGARAAPSPDPSSRTLLCMDPGARGPWPATAALVPEGPGSSSCRVAAGACGLLGFLQPAPARRHLREAQLVEKWAVWGDAWFCWDGLNNT